MILDSERQHSVWGTGVHGLDGLLDGVVGSRRFRSVGSALLVVSRVAPGATASSTQVESSPYLDMGKTMTEWQCLFDGVTGCPQVFRLNLSLPAQS
jgi:hypothetical protein